MSESPNPIGLSAFVRQADIGFVVPGFELLLSNRQWVKADLDFRINIRASIRPKAITRWQHAFVQMD